MLCHIMATSRQKLPSTRPLCSCSLQKGQVMSSQLSGWRSRSLHWNQRNRKSWGWSNEEKENHRSASKPASKTVSSRTSWAERQSEVLANRPNKEKGSCECGDNWSETQPQSFFSLRRKWECVPSPTALLELPFPLPLGQRRPWHRSLQ